MIVVEKILTGLVMPSGLIWLGLMALSLLAWRRRQRSLLAALLVLLAFHTLAGNVPLGHALLAWLERDYAHVDPLEQGPFDAVFVLGGGTETAPNGEPQLSAAGDRVALGARLYHVDRTRRLVTTGERIAVLGGRGPDPSRETADLWRQMAVADDHVLQLAGRNTREEMAAIRRAVDEHDEWERLGLVTSAWHMRRAMRLADKHGLALEPLPADFHGIAAPWSVLSIIPTADGFLENQLAFKEVLAVLLGK